MPTRPNDTADLHALQSGDDRALDRLIARWERPLFGFAWRYLRHDADARDVAIETFVRLHQQRARLRPDSNLSAWLFTTAANLCRNHHRWRRRHPSLSLDAADESGTGPGAAHGAVDDTPAPDAALLQKEALDALGHALDGLPHELKTVLLLHHFERLSYREIGEITGCRERGVETRLYRARHLLREAVLKTMNETADTAT